MSEHIKDGTGNGHLAKVDSDFRLHTHAYTVTINQAATLAGDTFDVSTGVVTLTSDNESGIFYIENTSDDDLLVFEQFLLLGASTGGASNNVTIKYYTGATGGTVISDEVVATVDNRRLLDSKQLGALSYKGSEAKTLSGGNESSFITSGFNNTSPFVIPPGINIGVSIQPSTGNTSQAVTFGINLIANATKYGND